MKRFFYTSVFILLFTSCEVFEGPEKIVWVYPYKVDGPLSNNSSEGVFFLISDSIKLNYAPQAWRRMEESFEIKDFDFERGYFQKLLIRELSDQPSKTKWKVKSVLEKRKNFVETIKGSWESIPTTGFPSPYIELGISEISRTATVNSNCWIIYSTIGEIDEKFVDLIVLPFSGRDLCGKRPPWEQSNGSPDGIALLSKAQEYKISPDGYLDFFDEQSKFIIRFKPSE